jgi:NTP pyrophosphatase (non-canonical NTP hydrolase)
MGNNKEDEENVLDVLAKTVSQRSILEQLMEEAGELIKAASKLIRTDSEDNPTPVSKEEAFHSLIEEWSDLGLCLEIYLRQIDTKLLTSGASYAPTDKAERWIRRLAACGAIAKADAEKILGGDIDEKVGEDVAGGDCSGRDYCEL